VNGDIHASTSLQTDGELQVAGSATITGAVRTGPLTVNAGNTYANRIWKTNDIGESEWVEPTSVFSITGPPNYIAKFNADGDDVVESDIFNEGGKVRIGEAPGDLDHKLHVNEQASTGTGNFKRLLKAASGANYMSFYTHGNGSPNFSNLEFGLQAGSSGIVNFDVKSGDNAITFLTSSHNGTVSLGKTIEGPAALTTNGAGLVHVPGHQRIGNFSGDIGALYDYDLQTEKSIVIGKRASYTNNHHNRLIFSGGLAVGQNPDPENAAGINMHRVNISDGKSALRINLGGILSTTDPEACSRVEIGHEPAIGQFIPGLALCANGHIVAKKVKVTLDNLNDIVFLPTYKLRSLKETEAYIKANGHPAPRAGQALPEVPSQAEVAKDGLDVGEMNNILLKKIEEMTLHLIRMEKEIEALKNQK
jgi:hypothetical protein